MIGIRIRNLCTVLLVFAAVGISAGAGAAAVVWHTALDAARMAAAPAGKKVLVLLAGEGSLAQANEKLLADPAVQARLAPGYEFCRVDFARNRNIALSLGAYKVGAIVVCDLSGKPVDVIMESLPASVILERLAGKPAAVTEAPFSPARIQIRTPSPTEIPTGPTPPPKHPKGKLVTGPVLVSATKPDCQNICLLQKDKRYVLVIEGVFGVWQTPRNHGADACFLYEDPKRPGKLRSADLVYTCNPDAQVADLIRAETGADPVYSPTHVYEAVVTGQGKSLGMRVKDTDYKDNSGDFMVRVYELD